MADSCMNDAAAARQECASCGRRGAAFLASDGSWHCVACSNAQPVEQPREWTLVSGALGTRARTYAVDGPIVDERDGVRVVAKDDLPAAPSLPAGGGDGRLPGVLAEIAGLAAQGPHAPAATLRVALNEIWGQAMGALSGDEGSDTAFDRPTRFDHLLDAIRTWLQDRPSSPLPGAGEARMIVARALAAEHGMELGAHDEEDQLDFDRKATEVLRRLAGGDHG